eukprot:gene377-399_t
MVVSKLGALPLHGEGLALLGPQHFVTGRASGGAPVSFLDAASDEKAGPPGRIRAAFPTTTTTNSSFASADDDLPSYGRTEGGARCKCAGDEHAGSLAASSGSKSRTRQADRLRDAVRAAEEARVNESMAAVASAFNKAESKLGSEKAEFARRFADFDLRKNEWNDVWAEMKASFRGKCHPLEE